MAEKRTTGTKGAQRPLAKDPSSPKRSDGFSEAEREAMKARAKELKAEARASKDRAAGERAVREKFAEMPPDERTIAERIHDIVTTTAPSLSPKTWYGMPAYADRDGKVVCFFTPASKFAERYSTFGFQAAANLDQGRMWPTSFAVTGLSAAEEKKIAALVKKAVRT